MIFDAFIGNNDRHFYNWGIIRDIRSTTAPTFAPIYDTARGLFWNYDESQINTIIEQKSRLNDVIKNYCERSSPKTGWEGKTKLNHFDLLENMKLSPVYLTAEIVCTSINSDTFGRVISMIDNEFHNLLSENRLSLIKKCLEYRYQRITKMFNIV